MPSDAKGVTERKRCSTFVSALKKRDAEAIGALKTLADALPPAARAYFKLSLH